MISIDQLLDRLTNVRRYGRGYLARCPAHEDRRPSLKIDEGRDWLLLYCWAGCSVEAITTALGIRVADLAYVNDDGSPARLPATPASTGLANLITQVRPPDMSIVLTRFDDVAWLTMPQYPREYALAAVLHHDLVQLPYEEAMRYWVTLQDGWLWDWIGAAWQKDGRTKLSWYQMRDLVAIRMDRTWRTSGFSVSR
jgi:hypothetical protein